ncbi:MAG: cytochrome c3 family protein [bacterium]
MSARTIGLALAVLLATTPASAAGGAKTLADAASSKHAQSATDCAVCHVCPQPTRVNPCLVDCPRHEMGAAIDSTHVPGIVILDQLEDLYVPVRFDHATHARMTRFSGDCTACHHYSPTDEEPPACRSCHPVEIQHEDLAQPGLKGAYHRQCLGCHSEWDADTKCELCHEKKAGGRLEGHATDVAAHAHYAPIEVLEIIRFPTGFADGDTVAFHHRRHATLYEPDCAFCHREQSCQRCHTHGQPLHPMGAPEESDLHEACFRCHDEDTGGVGHVGGECEHCHGRPANELFDHSTLGWKLASYHKKVDCRSCHGSWVAASRPDRRCESCHRRGFDPATFDHRVTGAILDETHAELECTDCHGAGWGGAPSCDDCHDDGRHWSAKTGFRGAD